MARAQHPVAQATLDMDATLIETQKREALYCYKHFKAYQPLNTWWAEAGPDRAFGVPRRQRAGGARAIARSRRGGAPAAVGGDQALSALGHGRLSAGS